ncbi:hypothetical protein ACEQ8H_001009 [Pleosporales sp. CAS-2024a]
MTSGTTLSSLFLLFLSCTPALTQSVATQQVSFNQVLNVNGDMTLNSFQFPDRSKIETFSQKQQQIIVNQQTPAIPANQVTGTTGQPFVAISPQSMTISTNNATDLVGGQIEMAISIQAIQQQAVQPDNTYVAMLSPDRQTWMIQESMRTVNSTDMTVRMVKRTQLDGEYMILGRQTVETNTLVQPFGSDAASAVTILGSGLQENEFQDGFRLSTRATQPMTINVNVKQGVDSGMLAALQGQSTVNNFRYSVTTNLGAVIPGLNQQVTVVQMPINAVRIQKMMQAMGIPPTGQVAISVAQRSVLQNPGGATGNLGGASGATTARRHLGRGEFRKEVARQIQAAHAQSSQTGQAIGQTTGKTTDQTTTDQGTTTDVNSTGQTTTGQTPTGQQQQQAGQAQAGTRTSNNPVAQQLLLSPTFTPVAAKAVLDQANMRIAIPVGQIDGEFILTMQRMASAPQGVQPAQQSQSQVPELGKASNSTGSGSGSAMPTGGPAGKKAERRQDSNTDQYGNEKPPQGAVMVTMKMIDDMVQSVKWAGQPAITQMMSDYVKANTGSDLQAINNKGTGAANGTANIVV